VVGHGEQAVEASLILERTIREVLVQTPYEQRHRPGFAQSCLVGIARDGLPARRRQRGRRRV
jgi:hypothetical protein